MRQVADDPTGIRFPQGVVDGVEATDAVVRVAHRYHGGLTDHCAGVILHWVDRDNYLVARVNSIEQDLRIFRVANGLRTTLPGGRVAVPEDDREWHTLEFRAEGEADGDRRRDHHGDGLRHLPPARRRRAVDQVGRRDGLRRPRVRAAATLTSACRVRRGGG
ncbi:MAG: hypothetical protein R3F34_09690 [Planctomycetota bacterium]